MSARKVGTTADLPSAAASCATTMPHGSPADGAPPLSVLKNVVRAEPDSALPLSTARYSAAASVSVSSFRTPPWKPQPMYGCLRCVLDMPSPLAIACTGPSPHSRAKARVYTLFDCWIMPASAVPIVVVWAFAAVSGIVLGHTLGLGTLLSVQ